MKIRQIALGSMFSICLTVPALSPASVASPQGKSDQPTMLASNESTRDARQAIENVQHKLKTQGYFQGNVDGVWGPSSNAALQRYQHDNNLQATGTMDQATANQLGLSQGEFSSFEQAVSQQQPGSQNLPNAEKNPQ